jgi:hypothetical protein
MRGVAKAAAAGGDSPQDRLLKYIPLTIAGAYPLLENGIAEYIKTPIAGLAPRWIEWAVFGALILWYLIFLQRKFNQEAYRGWTRLKLQGTQMAVSIIAFCLWTYSVKSAIWTDIYNAGLALILTLMFLLFAGFYTPTVTTNDGA